MDLSVKNPHITAEEIQRAIKRRRE